MSNTSLGYTDSLSMEFEYELTAEQWWEVPTVEVYVGGERVYRGMVGEGEGNQIFTAESYGTATGTINQTVQTGGETELSIGLTPSNYCSNADHANTYLTIRDLLLTADL